MGTFLGVPYWIILAPRKFVRVEKLSLGLSVIMANPTKNNPISSETMINERTTEPEMVQTLANVDEVPLGSVLKMVPTY